MSLFTTTMAILGGATLTFGVLYGFLGARETRHRRVYLLFACFSLAYGVAILSARTAYLADTIDDHVASSRITAAAAALALACLLWYVRAFTSAGSSWFLVALTGALGVVGAVSLLAPGALFPADAGIEVVSLPWSEDVTTVTEDDALLLPLVVLVQILSIVYIVWANISLSLRGRTTDAVYLAVGTGWLVLTLAFDIAVSTEAIDFVFLSDVGFLGFVMAGGLQLAGALVDAEEVHRQAEVELNAELELRTQELEAAQAELLEETARSATSEERTRLARELHDSVTQLLFSINLLAQSLPRLIETDPAQVQRSAAELSRLTRGALAEMRTLLWELRPSAIVATDLDVLITELTDAVAVRNDLEARVESSFTGELPPEVQVATYRIAQESLANIIKHAQASAISVRLEGDNEHISMHIEDDGVGLKTDGSSGGLGLLGMAERATAVDARLDVRSDSDGTTVDLTWTSKVATG